MSNYRTRRARAARAPVGACGAAAPTTRDIIRSTSPRSRVCVRAGGGDKPGSNPPATIETGQETGSPSLGALSRARRHTHGRVCADAHGPHRRHAMRAVIAHGAGFGCNACNASISASTSAERVTPTLSMFSFNCSSDVAPIRLLRTNGWLLTNASASCAGDRP